MVFSSYLAHVPLTIRGVLTLTGLSAFFGGIRSFKMMGAGFLIASLIFWGLLAETGLAGCSGVWVFLEGMMS